MTPSLSIQSYKKQKFISHCSGGWKSKIRTGVTVWSGSGEEHLPFSRGPPSCCTLTRWEQPASPLASSSKGTNPIYEGFTLMT